MCVCVFHSDSESSMREDREDRDAYRRGGPEEEDQNVSLLVVVLVSRATLYLIYCPTLVSRATL